MDRKRFDDAQGDRLQPRQSWITVRHASICLINDKAHQMGGYQ
jgi:hypothetical protein